MVPAPVQVVALLSVLWAGSPGMAQQIATSPGPDSVSVTVYRAPHRSADEAMDLEWLNGYALISETRRVSIPAGEGDIRFEGVAAGIVPESAIVTGLPDGVIEKNQDAYLLSPASLLDRTLGRRVHIRRTSRTTGKTSEHDAVIRSGADGAVVLQTAEGFEALRCSGIPETLVYNQVPEGLSAKPTLSVRTRSASAASATITLSYLASGFDWQANYVATLNEAEDRVDLLAWVTLANGDETSFANAETKTVAGRLNRVEEEERGDAPDAGLHLSCWPAGTTSNVRQIDAIVANDVGALPAPAMEALQRVSAVSMEDIVVTGARRVQQEELGDLKLYRVPDPVTIASKSQKQVSLLERKGVKVEVLYRAEAEVDDGGDLTVTRILKARNRTQEGLGVPLPAGGVVLFASGYSRPVMVGEGSVEDRAIGEDVEVKLGEASGILAEVEEVDSGDGWEDHILTVTNSHARPVRFEAELAEDEDWLFAPKVRLGRRNGRYLWSTMVPAGGTAVLRYRLTEKDDEARAGSPGRDGGRRG